MACAWRLPHGGDLNIPLCWWNNAWGEKIGPCPLGLSSCLIVSQPWLPFLPTIWGDDWNPTYSNDNDLGMVYYWIYNIAWYHVMSTAVIGTMACWRTFLYDITWNEQKSGGNEMMSPAMAIQVAPCATQTEQTGRRWTSHANVYHFSPVTNNSQGKIGESSKFSEETSPPRGSFKPSRVPASLSLSCCCWSNCRWRSTSSSSLDLNQAWGSPENLSKSHVEAKGLPKLVGK